MPTLTTGCDSSLMYPSLKIKKKENKSCSLIVPNLQGPEHTRAAESLHLIVAGQNSLLPSKRVVMFLTPFCLWSHHPCWRHLGSQHCPPDVLRSDCRIHTGAHKRAPRNSRVVRHRQLCLLGIYKRHIEQKQPVPFSSLIGSGGNLLPRINPDFQG